MGTDEKKKNERSDNGDSPVLHLVKEEVDEDIEKPSMDLFKAIFANSDADSDEESDGDMLAISKSKPHSPSTSSQRGGSQTNLGPTLSNGDQASGIFAGIDF